MKDVDGSIRIETKLDNSGVKQGLKETESALSGAESFAQEIAKKSSEELIASGKRTTDKLKEIISKAIPDQDKSGFGLNNYISILENERTRLEDDLSKIASVISQGQEELAVAKNEFAAELEKKIEETVQRAGDIEGDAIDASIARAEARAEAASIRVQELSNFEEQFIQNHYGEELDKQKELVSKINKCTEEINMILSYENGVIEDFTTSAVASFNELYESVGADLQTAIKDNDYLDRIKSEEAYQEALRETTSRLRMVYTEAEKIAKTKGLKVEEVTATNNEYANLSHRLQLLQKNQDRYKGLVKETAKETEQFGKQAQNTAKKVTASNNTAKKSAKSLNDTVSDGIKKLGKMALAAFGVRAAYSAVRKAASQYMSDNERLSNQISAIWEIAAQAVGPAVEKIANWISIAVAYTNAFIKALTGVDLIARANEAALKRQTKATKEAAAAAQTAGFDEMTKLSNTSSGPSSGSDFSKNALFDVQINTSAVDKAVAVLDKSWKLIKDKFSEFTAYITTKFSPSIESWKNAFSGLKEPFLECCDSISTRAAELWDNSLGPLGSRIVDEFVPNIVNDFSETFAPIFSDVMPFALEEFLEDFDFLADQIKYSVDNIVNPSISGIETVWGDMCDGITSAWDESGKEILTKADEAKEGMREIFNEIRDNIFDNIFSHFKEKISELWDNHLKPLWDNLTISIGKVSNCLLTLWNKVGKPFVDDLVDKWAPKITNAFNFITDLGTTLLATVSDMVGGIIEAIGGIADFISGVFECDWKKALNGLLEIIDGFNAFVWGGVKGLINLVIDGLNFLWRKLYKSVSDAVNGVGWIVSGIGDFLGKDWGWEIPKDAPEIPSYEWDIPKIPKLALGGIVSNPGRGVPVIAGEAGREAVLPLDRNTEWMDELAGRIGTGGQIVVNVILNGKTIQKEIYDIERKRSFAENKSFA